MTVDARRLFPSLHVADPRVHDRVAGESPLLADLRARLADDEDEDLVPSRVPLPSPVGRRRLVPVMALDEVERWFG